MDDGYIKLFRSLKDWEWYQDSHTKDVFIHLLLNANWEDFHFKGYEIPKGSLVTGYSALSRQLGISIKSARTAIKHLKATGEITVKVTNRFSIVTIANWEKFQGGNNTSGKQSGNQNDNQTAIKGQSKGINKEIKNIRNKEENIYSENSSVNGETLLRIKDAYNQQLNLRPCKSLTKVRMDKLLDRLNDYSEEEIISVFKKANSLPRLIGEDGSTWKADFDWLLDETNFIRVQEGYYDFKMSEEKKPDANKGCIKGNYNFEELAREEQERAEKRFGKETL